MQLLNLKDKAIHILNGFNKSCDKLTYMNNIGVKISWELPYIASHEVLLNSGRLFYSSPGSGRGYRKVMQKLASQMIL